MTSSNSKNTSIRSNIHIAKYTLHVALAREMDPFNLELPFSW